MEPKEMKLTKLQTQVYAILADYSDKKFSTKEATQELMKLEMPESDAIALLGEQRGEGDLIELED